MNSNLKKSREAKSSTSLFEELIHKPLLPTTFELTQIAAVLSGKLSPQDVTKLTNRAFQPWEASGRKMVNERILRSIIPVLWWGDPYGGHG